MGLLIAPNASNGRKEELRSEVFVGEKVNGCEDSMAASREFVERIRMASVHEHSEMCGGRICREYQVKESWWFWVT